MWRRTAIIVLAVCLVGCGGPRGVVQTPRGQVIDGWPVGEEVDCTTVDGCDDLIEVARDRLAARDLFAPSAVRAAMHTYRQDEDGIFRSGGAPLIAVFQMADGSLRGMG